MSVLLSQRRSAVVAPLPEAARGLAYTTHAFDVALLDTEPSACTRMQPDKVHEVEATMRA